MLQQAALEQAKHQQGTDATGLLQVETGRRLEDRRRMARWRQMQRRGQLTPAPAAL